VSAPDDAARKPREVPCPRCGQPALFAAANPHRPFCSERCRSIDFGAWASEAYSVVSPLPPGDADAAEPSETPSPPPPRKRH
jgi:uncharacterized protein